HLPAEPSAAQAGGGLPYPTLRSLPLLGAKYGDYYRRAKIQETVYELLTEQYELAKVQEAKETPSVKVLDPATIPERKSFPPRLLITGIGAALSLLLGILYVIVQRAWLELDSHVPEKLLIQEIIGAVKYRWQKVVRRHDGN